MGRLGLPGEVVVGEEGLVDPVGAAEMFGEGVQSTGLETVQGVGDGLHAMPG